MSAKEIAIEVIGRMGEDSSLHEIAREIEFMAGVQEGLAELDRGEGVPLEQVEKDLPSWVIK